MRIAVVCNDTRGGVQPYVALGLGLKRAGHEVCALAPADLAGMFADVGIAVAPLSDSSASAVPGALSSAERGTIATMRFAARELPMRMHAWTRQALAACEGADVITGGVGGMVVALSVAEKLGKPFIETHLQPIGMPTAAYPGVLLARTPLWLGAWGRRLSHHLSEMALWLPFKGAMQSARENVLGLSGRANAADGQPVLYGFSRHVLDMPVDALRPRYVTGYWTLPTMPDWQPPPALEAFLDGPGPLVSIGFGSMGSSDPELLGELICSAVRRAGVRAVLLSGWSGLKRSTISDDVFFADQVPHEWLFPKLSAIVHHGGAGTTGAALRSGVPSLVVPFAVDQPFWGARVAALGVGPTPIPRKQLTMQRLGDALRDVVTNAPMRERAAELGAKIRVEDGVAIAVEHFARLRFARAH